MLILEVGTEEIPARFLPDTIQRLRENGEKLFGEYRLSFKNIRAYATPRRLTLVAEIDPMQRATEKEVWGPPVQAAYDQTGNPTKAAEAFARAHNLDIRNLQRREKGKGLYVVAVVSESSQPVTTLLPYILPKLITSLSFPKSMRWGDGTLRFARPIHWILALYKSEKVQFALEDLKSGSTTRGHRFLSPATFEVKDGRAYVNLLRNNFVILDPEERRKMIIDGIGKLATSISASLVDDDELLQHVVFLIEYPSPVLGSFPQEYLSLPRELLITVMRGHQKYFALQEAGGSLTNFFVTVSNTRSDNAPMIRRGAEKVIKARFEDARFYYDQDRKTPSMVRLEGLRKVIYHDRLGTLYEKTQRLTALAGYLASRCAPAKAHDVHTAALLSKTDLITGVVREFPELQGIMGMYYARAEGYGEEIAQGLAEHYMPAYSGAKVPETDIGAILSLADKLDNLASFFMLGQTPSGTEDPFALRRQAIGITSILRERRYDVDLTEALTRALDPFSLKDPETVVTDLVRFFEQRFEPYFAGMGFTADSIASVVHLLKDRPMHSLEGRLAALRDFRDHADYPQFLLAIKRVNNISPREEMPLPDPVMYEHNEERGLHSEVERVHPEVERLLREGKYLDALTALASVREAINSFFDKVLVMDKREEVKRNRLALIKTIQVLSHQIADFAKLS